MTRDEFRNSDSISVVLGRVALRGGNVKRTEKNREELDNAIDIVDGEIANNDSGYRKAAWNGISGAVVLVPTATKED